MFTSTSRKTSTALLVSAILAFIIVTIALAAELITVKDEEPVNEVTLPRGGSAEFEISIWADGVLDCNVDAQDPAKAWVHTSFTINQDGEISSQDFSDELVFYAIYEPGSVNCAITWTGVPDPYTVNATIFAHPDAVLGEYEILLSVEAGTTMVYNPPAAAAAKLNDKISTHITVHLVEAEYGLTLEPDQDALYGDPGEMVEYTLSLTNTGNVPDTFELTFEDNLWDVHLPEDIFELAASESVEVIVQVSIPADAMAGEHDTAIVTATSQSDENATGSSILTTTANTVYGLTLEPETDGLSGDPGEMVIYTLTLTNTGNVTDTFNLATAGNLWGVHLPVTSFELDAWENAEISVNVIIPADAMASEYDIVTITAISIGNGDMTASAILTTTANAVYGLELTTVEDTQYGDPGESVTYHLTLTNTGNASDTFEITFSENTWEVLVAESTFELEDGESTQIEVQVNIPVDALAGESDIVLITASSQADEAVSASITLTTLVSSYGVTISPKVDAKSSAPGKTITYNLILTNTGNINDTFQVTLAGNVWSVNLLKSSYILTPAASAIVVVRVTIPDDAQNGDTDTVAVTATSAGDPSLSASATLTTTAVVEPEPEPTESFLFMPIISKG